MACRVRLLFPQSKGRNEMEGLRDREGTLKRHLFESIDATIRERHKQIISSCSCAGHSFSEWKPAPPEDVREGLSSSSSIVGPFPTARPLGALLSLMEFIVV